MGAFSCITKLRRRIVNQGICGKWEEEGHLHADLGGGRVAVEI
jgi:hypothetical protein